MFTASVSSDELERWSDRLESRSLLPELIWRLLLHSGTYDLLEFPARGGIQSHGWDGVVDTKQARFPVPAGKSGWEVSCRADVQQKANEDYRDRQENSYGLEPAETTFVFATARRFPAKNRWISGKKGIPYWQDVRAYDSQNLAVWIADSPLSVAIWLRNALGLSVDGAEDLSRWWDGWSNATSPAVPESVVLSGRVGARDALNDWLNQAPSAVTFRAETVSGATAILAATLRTEVSLKRDLARATIVHSLEAWDQIVYGDAPMILVPWFDDKSRAAAAVTQGHHVLIPVDYSVPLAVVDIGSAECRLDETVPEVARFIDALPRSKVGQTGFGALTRKSLTVLRRQIAIAPASLAPAWASPTNGRSLVGPLLAGSWDESNENDRRIVGTLGASDYATVLSTVGRWAVTADSPIERVGSEWRLRDPRDAWVLLHAHILPHDLAQLEAASVEVLTERDPKLDQPEDEQWLANVLGHVPRHSASLRFGIAESLAVLGSLELSTVPKNNLTDAQWACRIVRRVLEKADDWRLWASLGSLLSLLAEGCPDEFLAAISRATTGSDPPLRRVFRGENGHAFLTSPHTELLSALEILAWSSRHFGAAVDALARLTEIDPGGPAGARPLDSLVKIFLAWHPNTSASAAQRLEALDVMKHRHPVVAWMLMQSILPKYMGVAHPSATPTWRAWAAVQPEVTHLEVHDVSKAIVERLVSNAGRDVQRWKDLIGQMNHLPFRDQIISGLEAADLQEISGDDMQIWHRLRNLIANHRRFPAANWVMSEQELGRLEAVAAALEPAVDVDRIGWLFSDKAMIAHDVSSLSDYEAALQSSREDALRFFIDKGEPMLRIEQLAESVDEPRHIGMALAGIGYGLDEPGEILLATLESPSEALRKVGRGYVGANVRGEKAEWVSLVMQSNQWTKLSSESKATTVVALRFQEALWPLLQALDEDTKHWFWRLASITGNGELDEGTVERVAQNLLAHGLTVKAFNFLSLYSEVARPEKIVETFQAVLTTETEPDQLAKASHEVVELLRRLNTAEEDVGDAVVGQLEWVLLPLIDAAGYQPVRLSQAIVRDPELFLQLVALFTGDSVPQDADHLARRGLATRAFDMLQHARAAPGLEADGSVNAESVRWWVGEVRELARQRGLLPIADNFIGGILHRLPADADGSWPRKVVRDIIEDAESEELYQLRMRRGRYGMLRHDPSCPPPSPPYV